MLLSLNDDCLRLIGEILCLEDQITLSHVCRRLQLVVKDIWHHTSKNVSLNREQCEFFERHEKYFYEFMRCISDNVQDFELDRIKSSLLHSLQDINFPKLQSLSVTIQHSGRMNYDRDVQLFGKLYPQLTKLTICSGITGRLLWDLKNLEELHLMSCEDLRTKHIKKIFTTLRLKKLTLIYYGYNTCLDQRITQITECKTLEELYIDDHHLMMMIDELLKLKNLRKITTYTRDYDTYLLNKISKCLGSAMHTMIFNDVFWSKDEHLDSIERMINLRRLVLSDDDIEDRQIHKIGQYLSQSLEELYFVNVRAEFPIKDGLLCLLTQCLNLKVLDVSNTTVDIKFIESIAKMLESIQGQRKAPLLLHCFGTRITNVEVELLMLPTQLLHVSLQKYHIDLPGSRHLQFEWRIQCEE